MAFQVLVKTTAAMNGAYTYLCGSQQEREQFVQRPDVWWYHFPEEDDDWRWHRGGAWKPAHELAPQDLSAEPAPPPGQSAQQVTFMQFAAEAARCAQDGDDDDERW